MLKAEAVVVNRLGLHARPSASVVATASKFRRRAAVAAGVPGRLCIRVTGARIPPNIVTPISQGISFLPGGASMWLRRVPAREKSRAPAPLPSETSAASASGPVPPMRSLVNGALPPIRTAVISAQRTGPR